MLVLSRRQGEEIVIAGRIRVVISQVSGNRVRVAIDAPPEVTVHRGELRDRLHDDSEGNQSQPVGRWAER